MSFLRELKRYLYLDDDFATSVITTKGITLVTDVSLDIRKMSSVKKD